MIRDLKRLGTEKFDLLVIGGGITGACVAWDASMRGLSVAMIDKGDFGAATSSATSKLIHGGLRYLKNFELGIVRESLKERRIMEFIAPHLVSPLPFVIPNYGMKDTLMLKAGMTLYDLLGYDKGRLADPDKRIPGHRGLSKAELSKMFPRVPGEGLSGGFHYYDCQMISSERLTLSFVKSAAAAGATVANWLAVESFKMSGKRIQAAVARDEIGGETIEIQADCVLNATGCWADRLLGMVSGGESKTRIARSKGIHIVIPQLHPSAAIAMITKTRRHVFLMPWRGLTIAGTTDTPFKGDPDKLTVTMKDIEDFTGEINGCMPSLNLTPDDVIMTYGGLRPLADPDGAVEDSYDASRKHEVIDHSREGLADNLLSALGGKYTTSRFLAAQVTDAVFGKLGKPAATCKTAVTRLATAPDANIADFKKDALSRRPDLPAELVSHLSTQYGAEWEKVASLIDGPGMKEKLVPGSEDVAAQLKFAAESECAAHLDDALLRRSDALLFGKRSRAELVALAKIMAPAFGWDDARCEAEASRVEDIVKAKFAE
jgi:glycerol-3-phosphate dehydrogenase